MEVRFRDVEKKPIIERNLVASAILPLFKGYRNVEIQIFRYAYPANEIEALRGKNLVGPPAPGMPPELVAQASEEAALRCVLEAFTKAEAEQLAAYLQNRYSDQIATLDIAALDLPAPLGVGPLADIPTGPNSGFIKFDQAPGYSLPFAMRAYYELD